MRAVQLKLKQASAVLGVAPKDLQNLVQFGVVKPKRRAGIFVFDTATLHTAQIVLHLKAALGTRTELLSEYAAQVSARMADLLKEKPEYLLLIIHRFGSPVEVKVPFRPMTEKIEERLEQLPLFADLPRGRKRPGWKAEFLATLREAAGYMGEVSLEDIRGTVREYRREMKRKPEITVVAET